MCRDITDTPLPDPQESGAHPMRSGDRANAAAAASASPAAVDGKRMDAEGEDAEQVNGAADGPTEIDADGGQVQELNAEGGQEREEFIEVPVPPAAAEDMQVATEGVEEGTAAGAAGEQAVEQSGDAVAAEPIALADGDGYLLS